MSCSLQVYECFGPAVTAHFKKFHSSRLRLPNLPNLSSFYRDYTTPSARLSREGGSQFRLHILDTVQLSRVGGKILKLQSAVWLHSEHELCKEKWVSEVRGRHHVTRSSFIPSTCIIDEMEEEKHRDG